MKAKEYTKTLSILLDLINRFYAGESLSTADIENIYGISKRSAQRYINYLKDAGFNIKSKNRKYYLENIIDEEKEMIFEAIESLAKNAGIEKELLPLLKQLKLISEENVFYSKLDIEKIEPFTFRKIEEAIKNKKILKIKYLMDREIYDFEIKPLKISNFEGYWYVNALNHENKYRTYHIKSIKHLVITDESFEVEKDILKNLDKAVNIWYDPTTKPFRVELFADEYATKYLERIPISKTQKIIKNSDGTSTIYLEITHENEIIRKLLMWIPNLKVISPKWLKEEVDKHITNYIN
ncbi:helix-turn-helix transcriptional regulator [Nautilia lithotrophica]